MSVHHECAWCLMGFKEGTKMLWKAFGLPVAEMEVVTREQILRLGNKNVCGG